LNPHIVAGAVSEDHARNAPRTLPSASVIVRARDKEATIGATLSALRDQTVEAEIVVVDSGSRDRTVEIARQHCDVLIEIPPGSFTFGRALNVGAEAASGDINFSVSAHCRPRRRDWVERSLRYYDEPRVAATAGMRELPDGTPMQQVLYQDLAHAREHPWWGFANHASSWRASVWREFRFDELLTACEDTEWAWRVLAAGWTVVIDPALDVEARHRWESVRESYRRQKLEKAAIAGFADLPPYRVGDCLREWWSEMPTRRHPPILHRLDYRRMAYLAGKYRGLSATRSRTRTSAS
jgi:glycosyltransferase involved in cell wall biosynthesis